jgi:hypothetical protein
MKNFIKPFQSFVNESRESGYYPAGTEFDPSAPWNQNDPDVTRDVDWIDAKGARERIKFDLLATDYSEFAILKHLDSGELYVAYLGGDEIEEYMPKYQEAVGRDEDGDVEYEYTDAEMDDSAIIAMASDYEDQAGEGQGQGGGEEGLLQDPRRRQDGERRADPQGVPQEDQGDPPYPRRAQHHQRLHTSRAGARSPISCCSQSAHAKPSDQTPV